MVMKITDPKALGAPSVSVDVSPELLAGPTVRFQETLGKTTEEIGDFMLARQDQLDVIQVMTAESEWTIAEDAKTNDFLSRKGENAFDMLGEAEQWFDGYGVEPPAKPGDKTASLIQSGPGGKISEGFKNNRYENMNDRQKRAFDRLRIKRRSSFLKSVGMHENRERLSSIVASADAAIASHTADAIRNYLNPDLMKDNLSRIDSSSKAKAAAAGLSEEEAKRDLQVAKATIHEGVLRQYLATDDHESATTYMNEHKAELEGKSVPMMQTAIRAKKVTTEGLLHAREIMKLDPTKRDAALAKIEDADIQKEALTNVWRLDSQETKAKAFKRRQAQNSIYTKLYAKDKAGNYTLPDLKSIVGTEEWNNLDFQDRKALDAMLVARDAKYPTVRPEDSLGEMNTLYEMPRAEFLEKFNAMEYFGKLTERDMATMRARHERFTQEGEDDDFADVTNSVTNQMQQFGWSTSRGDSPRMGAFRQAAEKRYSQWLQNHNNQKPTTDEWQTELNMMSTSEQKQIENKYALPQPKPVGTEKDPRSQENMSTAFADANWRKASDGKVEKFYYERKAKMKIIIDKKVAEFKRKNNRAPDEDWYQREINKVGSDLVNPDKFFGGTQVLAGSLKPGEKIRDANGKVIGYKPSQEEKEHYVEAEDSGFFGDKEYSVGDIKKWGYENQDAAKKIALKIKREGKVLSTQILANEIYKWEKSQEKTPKIKQPIKKAPKTQTETKSKGKPTASQVFSKHEEYIKTSEEALKQIEERYKGNRLGQFLGFKVIALKEAAVDKDKEAFLKTWNEIKKDIEKIEGVE